MRRLSGFSGCLLIGLVLVGCGGPAVITALDEDQVIVQGKYPAQAQVRAQAERGCAFHGRAAVPVSKQCADESCSTQRFVFACKGSASPARVGPSPWLGISVDDVADHLYADPPGSSEVVVSRVYADGPGKRAGLRVGDIIETFNGVPVTNARMLVDLKGGAQRGRQIPIGVRRGANVHRLLVTAEE
jgi:hypothetical protein